MRIPARHPAAHALLGVAAAVLLLARTRAAADEWVDAPAAPSPPVEAPPTPSQPAAQAAPTRPPSPPAAPRAPEPSPERAELPLRRVQFIASTGWDYGTTDLLTVKYENGARRRLGANGGYTVAAGAAWAVVPSGALQVRGTLGAKYDMVRGSNGSAYYLAFPAELLLAWYPRPIRAAAGASLSLAPRLHGSGFLGEANLELRDSLGLVGEVVWVLPFIGVAGSYSAGVRYLWQKLQAKAGGNSVDASAVGVVFGVSL